MFHVGQKVVCVDDGPGLDDGLPVSLVRGSVYTISEIENLVGAIKTEEAGPFEVRTYFHRRRFRPVHTTSIEIFEAMLVPTPKEKVEA